MADTFSKDERSKIMSAVQSKDTKPEMIVRKYLFAKGFRFRKNVSTMPGKPDIVLPKYKSVILVHGCFWHGHICKRAKRPESNIEYWNSKIQSNIDRDKRVRTELKKIGWQVITVWDCQLSNKIKLERAMAKLIDKLLAKSASIPSRAH